MDFRTVDVPLESWSGDCLALGLFEDDLAGGAGPAAPGGRLAELDSRLAGALAGLLADSGFGGRRGAVAAVRPAAGDAAIGQLVVVGLGRREELRLDDLRLAGAAAARRIRSGRARTLGIHLATWNGEPGWSAHAIVEGVELALHEGLWVVLPPERFKRATAGDAEPPTVERVELLGLGDRESDVARARHTLAAVILSRELVAAPGNVISPAELAEHAEEIAAGQGLELEILDEDACVDRGMGALIAVGRGSVHPPRLLHLTYRPPGAPRRRLAVVGQGVTSDPRGLDHGVRRSIEGMKKHMGGAGSTLGAALAIGRIRPDVEVHFLVPAVEAGTGRGALRAGDLVRTAGGDTVEVNEVDAAGRLSLVDVLVFAGGLGVDAVVDVATCSDACAVALGEEIAGLWSTDDELAREVAAAADLAGEPLWRMPLVERYEDLLWAPFANTRCMGPPAGDALTAALFLRRFVPGIPWAHLDITGPVWSHRVSGYYNAGATGFGAATLVGWICGP